MFPREPVRLVVGLTGNTAREPVVMHPRVWDHGVPLVMLFVNLPFTRQLPTIQVNLVVGGDDLVLQWIHAHASV